MPVKKDASGRRSVQAEVEVPGTPEEVWRAIATGPGISSWFVPSEIEQREGGAAISHFGPGNSMDSAGVIRTWEPPRRFSLETQEGPGPVVCEWTVETRTGGACVVRVVQSWFASSDEWDSQFEGHEHGWRTVFSTLRLYLKHFRDKPCSAFQLMGTAPEPKEEAWAALAKPLAFDDAMEGARVKTPADAPPLAGLVERIGSSQHLEELLLRLDQPAQGLAHLFALPMDGAVCMMARFYLYGADAAAAAARAEPLWRSWMNTRFAAEAEKAPVR